MDSNHDIVPTLRMMDGVYTGLAADEIERLRARVALLERCADTSPIPGAEPTHRCKVCGAYWRKWNIDGKTSWNLNSHGCGECCDNALMGEQIEALVSPAKVGGDEREAFETWCKQEFPGLEVRVQDLLGTYTKSLTEWLYTGWQARAALSADGGEPHKEAQAGPLLCKAAATLPEGWEIVVEVENGYGGVNLIAPDGTETDFSGQDMLLSEQIGAAIDAAIAAKQSRQGDEQ